MPDSVQMIDITARRLTQHVQFEGVSICFEDGEGVGGQKHNNKQMFIGEFSYLSAVG